jgi:DUF971 family protein
MQDTIMAHRPSARPPDPPVPDVIAPSLERRCIDITWLDGHQSSYDFAQLRWQCPCAVCRGEGGAPGILATTTELTPEQTELVDLGPVGNYAMSLVWKDGHSTGIYSWEYLRALCPCPTCTAARSARG